MTSTQRMWLIAILVLLLVAAMSILRLRPQFWSRVWSSRVQLNGAAEKSAWTYRGQQGYVMIDLAARGRDQSEIYVVRISRNQVAVTTHYYFWFVSPFGALAKDSADPSIDMMHDKNNYTDPHLILGKNSAAFKTLAGESIHVEW